MNILFSICIVAATLLVSLTAGLLFAFALLVMPGIGRLDDRSFIRAFQEIDGIIQRGDSLFLLLWLGSAVFLILSAVFGFVRSETPGAAKWALLGFAIFYVLAVQLPTVRINIPLNNRLQQVRVEEIGDEEVRRARVAFEKRWNVWNRFRTVVATVVSLGLLLVLLAM